MACAVIPLRTLRPKNSPKLLHKQSFPGLLHLQTRKALHLLTMAKSRSQRTPPGMNTNTVAQHESAASCNLTLASRLALPTS